MSDKFFLALGTIGSISAVFGNLPMVMHLVKEKNSEGHSLQAWYIWEIASILLLIYAIHVRDAVFILLQMAWVVFGVSIIGLIYRYRKNK